MLLVDFMPTVPLLERQRQKVHKFKAKLIYLIEFKVSLCYMGRPYLRETKNFLLNHFLYYPNTIDSSYA